MEEIDDTEAVPQDVIRRAACILDAIGINKQVGRSCNEKISAQDQLYKDAVDNMLAFGLQHEFGHCFNPSYKSSLTLMPFRFYP